MTDRPQGPAGPEADAVVAPAKPKSGWLNLAVDYGPILVYLAVYLWMKPDDDNAGLAQVMAVVKGTVAFIGAAIVALIVSRWKLGHISPMLWLSTLLIVFFGSLTVLFQDPVFIQVKPTIIYVLFAAALLIGVWRGRPLLQYLLGAGFEGLSRRGWLRLSRNWGLFFVVLAILNEILRNAFSFDVWLAAKLWLFMPLSFLFTFTQIPMMMREGLNLAGKQEPADETPPS